MFPSPRRQLVLLTRHLSRFPPCNVTCSASAGRSVSSSKNVSLRPNRMHLVLVGARGARRGGGTGTTHFPYEQFQLADKTRPSIAHPSGTLCTVSRAPCPAKNSPPSRAPAPRSRELQRDRTSRKARPRHIHSQTSHNSDFLH